MSHPGQPQNQETFLASEREYYTTPVLNYCIQMRDVFEHRVITAESSPSFTLYRASVHSTFNLRKYSSGPP